MAETEERPAPPPRRWHWLALAAAGVVLASVTVTTTLWWLMRDEPASAEAEVAEGPAPALYAPLRGPLLAHYTVGSRQRYLQVAMTALTRDPEVVDAIEVHLPLLRNHLLVLLGSRSFEELYEEEGRTRLSEQARDLVNDLLRQEIGRPGVEAMLFTEFVMQ